ncbi:MAG: hypothetical protein ABI234_05650 [Ktedonobacteraceae bacterium]
MIFSSFFLLSMPVQAMPTHLQTMNTAHGCAPNTPPPVSGTPIPVPATSGSVWINEVLSDPHTTWNCQYSLQGSGPIFNSWIELYNPQSLPLDLYASRIRISVNGGSNWYLLPFGSTIAPGGFFVVFPLENDPTPPSMWNVILSFANTGIVIDQATIPLLLPDQSYARIPDGSANWQLVGQPTIDASNNASDQPVTATPTKTPSPTKTPTPTKTPSPTKTSTPTKTSSPTKTSTPTKTSSPTRGTGSPGSIGATQPTNTGTQPAGNQLQLPSDTTSVTETPDTASTSGLGQSIPAVPNTALDAWHIVWLISLLLLFCGSLVWCWRIFHTP